MRNEKTELQPQEQLARMTRANELPLLYMVLAFEFLSFMLLAFRTEQADAFSIRAALIVPGGTYLGYRLLIKRFHADRVLYILAAFLCGLGVILLRAVFTNSTNAEKQLNYLILALPMLIVGIMVPRLLRGGEFIFNIAMPCVWGLMGSCLVLHTGSATHSWLRIGSSLQIQPSEVLKPVTLVILASGFTRQGGVRARLPYLLFMAVNYVLIFLQPDLGALFLYFVMTVTVYAVGTGKLRTAAVVVVSAAVLAAAFVIVNRTANFKPYLNDRIDVFLNPWLDEYNKSRQIAQGLMSIASGGWFGAGLGLSSARLVSVVESDYIFAAAAEEYGIVFTLCIIGVYIAILLRGVQAALNARTRFHAVIAFGASVMFIAQAALIILGNLNIIPLTGVTLPFVSSGGSSMLSSCLMMGLILGVSSINAEDEYDDLMQLTKGVPAE